MSNDPSAPTTAKAESNVLRVGRRRAERSKWTLSDDELRRDLGRTDDGEPPALEKRNDASENAVIAARRDQAENPGDREPEAEIGLEPREVRPARPPDDDETLDAGRLQRPYHCAHFAEAHP